MRSFDSDLENRSRGGTLASLLSQMIRLPILAFVYGMEIFVKTVHGLQRIADQSVDALTGPPGPVPPSRETSFEKPPGLAPAPPPFPLMPGTREPEPEEVRKEQTKMPDTSLSDDMLKLVRYKVLFIKRDYEVAFPEQEELVHDNMTDTAFAAWKVAEFIQGLDHTAVPRKWLDKAYPPKRDKSDEYIHALPEDDKKYLRVYYEVMQRYPREKFKHDEREVEELEKIRKILDDRLQGGGGQAAYQASAPRAAVKPPGTTKE